MVASIKNKYLRGLAWVVVLLIALIILLYVGSLIANATSGGEAFTLGLQSLLGASGWLTWVVIGGIVIYLIYVYFADKPIWKVGTREVVFMAIGAALYGVLSWVTNAPTVIVVPSVSLVSLRPAIVIPPLFGFLFGPVVGFFVGAFGNVLGDAITGWGVFPAWDVGNGLVGLIPGLLMAFPERRKSLGSIVWVTIGLVVVASILTLITPNPIFANPITGAEANHAVFWWVLIVGAIVLAVIYFLFRERPDTVNVAIWGSLGVVIGIGFAAFADIFINGYTFFVAFAGEFVPAAGPNIIFVAVLGPLLLAGYQAAQQRAGR